jgi:16S rRNA (cytosine1402-N4)-methyltransferase
MNEHQPVLLTEVIQGLNIRPDGVYLDLTIGRAGHATKIYDQLKNGTLHGFDQDITAIQTLQDWVKQHPRAQLVHDNFTNFPRYLEKIGVTKVDGILLDLGVSSPQFDVPERGFSYRFDGPLDMRMDQRRTITAASILETSDLKTLSNMFRDYADETFAYPIAKAIINTRVSNPIKTTFALVDLIKRVKPKKALSKKGHPAKQVFQALRIAVNDEMNVLKETLTASVAALKPEGRLAVISFHSGEDRIVKQMFQSLTVSEGSRHGLHAFLPNTPLLFKKIKPYPVLPSEAEVKTNHRSESAVLRIIERKKDEE